MIRKCLSELSAIADKTRILLTKSKDKLCHDEFLSPFLHPLKISKLSSWHSLPMDSNSSFRIHRTSFQSSKKFNAFQVNFSREDRSWRERHLVVTQSQFEIAFVKDAVYDDSDYVIYWDTCCIFFRASHLCSVFKFIP